MAAPQTSSDAASGGGGGGGGRQRKPERGDRSMRGSRRGRMIAQPGTSEPGAASGDVSMTPAPALTVTNSAAAVTSNDSKK